MAQSSNTMEIELKKKPKPVDQILPTCCKTSSSVQTNAHDASINNPMKTMATRFAGSAQTPLEVRAVMCRSGTGSLSQWSINMHGLNLSKKR